MTDRPLRAVPEPEDFADLYDKLEPSAPEPSASGTWRPQDDGVGAEIKGRVAAVKEVDTKWGKKPVLTIETTGGERTVWVSHAVLRRKLEESPPARRARILIRYDGTKSGKSGHNYHVYSLAVDPVLSMSQGQNWVDVFNQQDPIKSRGRKPPDLPF